MICSLPSEKFFWKEKLFGRDGGSIRVETCVVGFGEKGLLVVTSVVAWIHGHWFLILHVSLISQRRVVLDWLAIVDASPVKLFRLVDLVIELRFVTVVQVGQSIPRLAVRVFIDQRHFLA